MNEPSVVVQDGKPRVVNEQQAEPASGAVIPPKAVPWLTALAAAAYVVAKSLPPHTVAAIVAGNVLDLAVLVGLASPGWRRPGHPSPPVQ